MVGKFLKYTLLIGGSLVSALSDSLSTSHRSFLVHGDQNSSSNFFPRPLGLPGFGGYPPASAAEARSVAANRVAATYGGYPSLGYGGFSSGGLGGGFGGYP